MKRYLMLFLITAFATACGGGSGGSVVWGPRISAITSFTASPATINHGQTLTITWAIDQTKTRNGQYEIHAVSSSGSIPPVFDPNVGSGPDISNPIFLFSCPSSSSNSYTRPPTGCNPGDSSYSNLLPAPACTQPPQTCNETGCGAGHETCQYHGSVTCTFVFDPSMANMGGKGTWDCRLPDNTRFQSLQSQQLVNGVPTFLWEIPLGTSSYVGVWSDGLLGGNDAYDYQYTPVTIN